MSDSELLTHGYTQLHEAHALAGVLVGSVRDQQAGGQPVRLTTLVQEMTAIGERLRLAKCAFRELENRALGHLPPKHG